MPKISVVMSVYNCEDYLEEAVDSILEQTYDDFEFIIIDDCSTDRSFDILKAYDDNRIKLIRNEKNMRLPASLNKGIKMASGEYIARMDADDISLKDRFAKQIEYMEKNRDILACGGGFQAIDGVGKNLYIYHPLTGERLSKYYLLPSPMAHPTVIMRRKELVDNNLFYDTEFSSAQDYDLWLRIIKKFRIANMPDILIKHRVHNKSISSTKTKEQRYNAYKIFYKNSPVNVSFDECMAIMHREFSLTPYRQALVVYKVFRTLDYMYCRNVIGYTVRYLMKKLI